MSGRIAGGVSSGGIALKHRGRIGEAACFGCGCWAEETATQEGDTQGPDVEVEVGESSARGGRALYGSSCTGTGEDIMRCMLASTTVRELQAADPSLPLGLSCSNLLGRHFGGSKVGGVLALVRHAEGGPVEVICGHTSSSMAYGFQASHQKHPTAVVSRREPGDSPRWQGGGEVEAPVVRCHHVPGIVPGE